MVGRPVLHPWRGGHDRLDGAGWSVRGQVADQRVTSSAATVSLGTLKIAAVA